MTSVFNVGVSEISIFLQEGEENVMVTGWGLEESALLASLSPSVCGCVCVCVPVLMRVPERDGS